MINLNYNKALIIGVLWTFAQTLMAGNSCEQQKANPQLYINASQKALEVQRKLNQFNPKVALIARVGSNLKSYNLHYSHVGFIVKDYPGQPGKWTVVHLLNECNTSNSSLFKQGLMNFFLDNLYTLEYQITILDDATQKKLYQNLLPEALHRLHNPRYSMIAYPFSTKYQNSNQWILEVIAASINPKSANSRTSIQKYLLKTGYKPSVIKIDSFSKLGATMFNSHIKFDDHPIQEQRSNQFSTVSVISVVDYLGIQIKKTLNSNQ